MVMHESNSPQLHEGLTDNLPSNYLVGTSTSGYVTAESLLAWARVFVQVSRAGIPDEYPIILFMDGYVMHLDNAVLQYLQDRNVRVVFLPSHTSEVLQPLVRMGSVKRGSGSTDAIPRFIRTAG